MEEVGLRDQLALAATCSGSQGAAVTVSLVLEAVSAITAGPQGFQGLAGALHQLVIERLPA